MNKVYIKDINVGDVLARYRISSLDILDEIFLYLCIKRDNYKCYLLNLVKNESHTVYINYEFGDNYYESTGINRHKLFKIREI